MKIHDFSTRLLRDFIYPQILKDHDGLRLPPSVIFWHSPDNILVPITRTGFLKGAKGVYVDIRDIYNVSAIGNYKHTTNNNKRLIQSQEKQFKYLKRTKNTVSISQNELLILHYGGITSANRYSAHPLNNYYKWYNSLITIVNDLKSVRTDKPLIIRMVIPDILPSRVMLDKHRPVTKTSTLDDLITSGHLNILELWRFINPDETNTSLLKLIPIDKMNQVELMLSCNNKILLINLGVLYASVKEHNYTNIRGLNSVPGNTMKKVLYKMLYTFTTETGVYTQDLKTAKQKDIKISIAKIRNSDSSKDDVIDIDKMLEEEVVEPEVVKVVVDDDTDNIQAVDEVSVTSTTNDIENQSVAYESLNDIKDEQLDYNYLISQQLDSMLENKVITKKKYSDLKDSIVKQMSKPAPYVGSGSISDMLDSKKDDYNLDSNKINSNKVVFLEEHNRDRVSDLKQAYKKKQYDKDILRSFYAMQKSGMIVKDYSITNQSTILGSIDRHSVVLQPINGRATTVHIDIPVFDEYGTFKLSGNEYKMISQRTDLPIRKISNNRVALSTFYGKLFIDTARAKKDDLGYWLQKKIVQSEDTSELILLSPKLYDVTVPSLYGTISRYTKSFRIHNYKFEFNYHDRAKLFKDNIDLKSIEDNVVVVGIDKKQTPIVMDFNNRLFKYENNEYREIEDLFTLLDIEQHTAPIEYSTVKIYKKTIPVVILLSYYIGLDKLLKLYKVKYTRHEPNERIHKDIIHNSLVFKFKDIKLVLPRDYGEHDTLFAGLNTIKSTLADINYRVMNDRGSFETLFSKEEYASLYTNEIRILEHMYVDPVAESNLKIMKEPITFKGLLIRANELLIDDNYINPGNISQVTIKGNERVAGMLYHTLTNALKEHRNRSVFAKSSLTIAPHTVLYKITDDSTSVIVDNINPIALLKQDEKVTFLGHQGRSKEGVGKETRKMHPSEIGVMSEASPDSGDVGIASYLTADPAITNLRGMCEDVNPKKTTHINMLSSTAMLAPFSDKDDVKRTNFTNVMASHIVPTNNMEVPCVRTGYETIVPIRVSDKYAQCAKRDGVVVAVTKTHITIKYHASETDKEEVVKIKLGEWTTKVESDSTYTHKLITSMVKNQEFVKDDTLVYDSLFFEPDVFNPNRVLYKQSTNVTVALLEDPQTYEDSSVISNGLTSKLSLNVTKLKSVVLKASDNIVDIKPIGSNVVPSDTLFTISNNVLAGTDLDERSIQILQSLRANSPKAKVSGVIKNIVIYYNAELNELSDSIRKIVEVSDKYLLTNYGYTGRVDQKYSINGIPLLEGTIEVKVYLEVLENMGVGDKAIVGNQLKCTVGEVMSKMVTEDETTEVDLIFSAKSIAARIVNSPDLIGTTSMCLKQITKNVCDEYFK